MWLADKGFFLNGKPVKLKGTCNHHDHAGVGAALPDRLQYYRIERLKEMGCNAYRTSHNPPTPELLDACDRLGMLVMDETRMMSSSPEGLSQLERMVRRDRNHPSVVMWSLGNEEREQGTERGARILTTMKRLVRSGQPDSQSIRIANANLHIHLQYIAWLADRRSWLAGDQFSLADIAAGAHLSVVDYLGDIPWDAHPEAKDWYARVKSRPSFRPLLGDHLPGAPPPRHYADLDF